MTLLSAALRLSAQHIVRAVRVPDHGVQPQAAVDAKGVIHLIYLTGDAQASNIWYVTSSDDGKSFTKPTRVNTHAGSALAIGTIRGPQMALGRDGIVHVAWMGSNESLPKFAGQRPTMLYTRLCIDGHFEPEKGVITKYAGLDGGGSVAADDAGNVYVAWHAPQTPRGDESTRRVFVARSRDDGKTFEAEKPVVGYSPGACACCGMRVLAPTGAPGTLVGFFRTAIDQVHRDTRAFVVTDESTEHESKIVDPMSSGVCLMSTYALAEKAKGRMVVAAWETSGRIRIEPFDLSLRAGAPVQDVSDDRRAQKHPTIAVDARGITLVAWAVGTGWNRGGAVAWRVFDKRFRPVPNTAGEVAGLPPWSKPAAVADSHGGFVVFY
jgi:hypothetical protein